MPELFGFLTPNCTWVIPLQKTAILKKQTRSFFWAKIESLDMLYTWKFFNFEIRVSLLQELRWSVSIIDWGWNVTPIPKEWAQMDFSSLILPNMSDFPTCHFQITVTSAGLYMQEQQKTRFNFAYNVDKNYKPSVSFLPNQLPFDTWWDQKKIKQIFFTVVVEVEVAQDNCQILPFPSNSLKSFIPLRKIIMIKKV